MLCWNFRAGLLVAGLISVAACNDSTGTGFEPQLVTDTVAVAAPSLPQNADLPGALDITGDGLGGIQGGRFPETPNDIGRWDFGLRIVDGKLSLVTARTVGVVGASSAISKALIGETFESLREAPGGSAVSSDTTAVLVEGAVYAARSREVAGGLFGVCIQFAKISPLEVDQVNGRTTLRITTNQQCNDPRLVEE